MGCFGSASSKQADSNSSDDSKSQKRRSDAITKQLQKDKQVCMPLISLDLTLADHFAILGLQSYAQVAFARRW